MKYWPFLKHLLLCAFLTCSASLTAAELPRVVSSATIFSDMAARIGGDLFHFESIVPIGGDPHLHEPTPRDAQIVSRADLILVNGLTFEGWLNELIENSGTDARVVTITEGIDPIASTTYQNATDPHAWMDASRGVEYITNILAALIALRPEQEQTLRTNFTAYKAEIEALDQYISEQINAIPKNRRILITSHDAFQYYGRRYGIRLESILGTSTDADVQTSDIIRLNKVISSTEVPAVFVESTINPKLLQQLASDNGIKVGGKLYADSLGDEDTPAGTYIGMLRYNTDTIVKGLSMERLPTDKIAGSGTRLLLYAGMALVAILLIGGLIIARRG